MTSPSHSITFPGAIYDANGRNSDGSVLDLQKEMDAHPHASHVTIRDGSMVACVWVLADDATPKGIPTAIMAEAVQQVLAGQGVLILAQRAEVEADVREGLLHALDLFTAPPEEAGRA